MQDQQQQQQQHIVFQAKLKAEPDNLLLLTRTRTDSRGRRHSVAVPLIPPPDGEKFEGGYHVERNPITGGARLVAPKQGIKSIHPSPPLPPLPCDNQEI